MDDAMTQREFEPQPGPAIGLPAAMLVLCAAAGLVVVGLFWPDEKPPEPQWLGMEVESLTPDVRAALGLHPDQRGVYVSDVVGVAADAGVIEGDVIVAVDQHPVTDLDSYRAAARASRGRPSVSLGVVRRGIALAIPVAGRPLPAAASPSAGTPVAWSGPVPHGYSLGPNQHYYPQQSWVPAALPPGCATCPNAAACLPGATGTPAAFAPGCATCPNAAACFPPGGATPAAFTRPCTTGACPVR